MRFLGWFLSLALHLALVALAIWAPKPAPMRVDLSLPVYTVDLVSLSGPKGAPGPAVKPAVEPAPKPEPEPEPEPEKPALPVKPEPKAVEIKKPLKEVVPPPKKPEAPPEKPKEPPVPEKPKKVQAPKPKPKPKPPKPKLTPEEELAQAMKKAKQAAAKKPKPLDPVARELQQLQQVVSAEDAMQGGGGEGGQGEGGAGAVSLVAVYAQIVERIIKENWRFPSAASRQNLQAAVEIQLDNDGQILNYRLLKPSGRPEFDASVLRAVDQTKSLPEPPKEELKNLTINFNLQEMVQ